MNGSEWRLWSCTVTQSIGFRFIKEFICCCEKYETQHLLHPDWLAEKKSGSRHLRYFALRWQSHIFNQLLLDVFHLSKTQVFTHVNNNNCWFISCKLSLSSSISNNSKVNVTLQRRELLQQQQTFLMDKESSGWDKVSHQTQIRCVCVEQQIWESFSKTRRFSQRTSKQENKHKTVTQPYQQNILHSIKDSLTLCLIHSSWNSHQ